MLPLRNSPELACDSRDLLSAHGVNCKENKSKLQDEKDRSVKCLEMWQIKFNAKNWEVLYF